MAIKDIETNKSFLKAIYVVQVHRDREKSTRVHNTTIIRHRSIRVPLAIAAIFGFLMWSTDVKNAYM